MRNVIFYNRVMIAILLAISCTKENNFHGLENWMGEDTEHYISKEQALDIVQDIINFYRVGEYRMVYMSDYVVKANTQFVTHFFHDSKTVDYDAWVIMVNTNMLYNSGKFWRYIYVDAYTGVIHKESMEWGVPQHGFSCCNIDFQGVETDYVPDYSLTKSYVSTSAVSKNWAIIISGGGSKTTNYERYWNDCSELYKCLRQVYGYQRDHIIVIMSDGTSLKEDQLTKSNKFRSSPQDLDGDGNNDINYSATKTNISKVFNFLKKNVKEEEQVLVFVTDHGGREVEKPYECFMVLWNDVKFYASEFADELYKLPSYVKKHVVLGQCNSGGYIGPLAKCSNISVATACQADEFSHALTDLNYDSFLYHWIAAAAGVTPYGNVVNPEQDGYDGISIEEIYKYAEKMNSKKERPRYRALPDEIGDMYGLAGTTFARPCLTGPEHISTSGPITIVVDKLPSLPYILEWETPEYVTKSSQIQNAVKLNNCCPLAMKRGGDVIAKLTTEFKTYALKHNVTLWHPGQQFTDVLIQGSLESNCFSLPFCANEIEQYKWTLIDGCDIITEPTYFVDFDYSGETPDDYNISVSFNNPLGELTTIIRHFQ